MSTHQIGYFLQLKKGLEQTFQNRHPEYNFPIEDWKGQEIRAFQSDLQETIGGYISEKWFYTHIKTTHNEKLPRIDILDMLAAYIGFENWASFVEQQNPPLQTVATTEKVATTTRKWSRWLWGTVITAGTALLLFSLLSTTTLFSKVVGKHPCRFCFVDADTQIPIASVVAITLLQAEETPLHLTSDTSSCILLENIKDKIRFVVSAAYYQSDTIERNLPKKEYSETIPLKKDDYALMLHYFSTQKVEDWKKRRAQLDAIIADNAEIVQIIEIDEYKETGIEIYTKTEFIYKMTMPLQSLKNIEILKTEYLGGKIVHIRFQQNEE